MKTKNELSIEEIADSACKAGGGCSKHPQHAPTPWITTENGIIGTEDKQFTVGDIEHKSDAVFIVRAVNSYQSMLDALKFAADKINDPALVSVLDEAIAKAEGK